MRLTQDRLCGVNIYSANIWALSQSPARLAFGRAAHWGTQNLVTVTSGLKWASRSCTWSLFYLSTQISQFQCQTHLGVSFCGFSSVPDPDGGENRGNSAFNTRCQAGTEATAAQYNYHPADKTTSSELIYPRHGQIAAAAFSTTSTVS